MKNREATIMKKFKIIFWLFFVSLILSSPAWATKCITHIVKNGESVKSITKKYTGTSNYSKLIVKKNNQGKFVFLKNHARVAPGEVVYIVKGKIKNTSTDKNVSSSAPLSQEAKPSDKPRVKTDFKKALKNWNGTAGYSKYGDLDAGENVKRTGYGYQSKLTIFPWKISNWKFGPEARYNFGKSTKKTPGRESEYKYDRLEFGIKAETKEDHQTTEFGIGISKQENTRVGTDQGQKTWSTHFRSSYEDKRRRARGEKFLPTHYISGEYQRQIKSKTSGGAYRYDESTLKIKDKIGLYDYEVTDPGFRITPELNLQAGYSWGKESTFIGGGPGLTIGDKKNDFAEVRFLNPRLYLQEKGSSRLEHFSIALKPDDISRGVEASMVKKYSSE